MKKENAVNLLFEIEDSVLDLIIYFHLLIYFSCRWIIENCLQPRRMEYNDLRGRPHLIGTKVSMTPLVLWLE